jgi:hypothetical protein
MLEGGVCCAQTPTAVEKTSNSSERGRMRFGCDNPECGRCQYNRPRPLVFGLPGAWIWFVRPLIISDQPRQISTTRRSGASTVASLASSER